VNRGRTTRALLTIAQAGQAHLFFGLLYESVVRIPDRLSSERVLAEDGRPLLRPGSPLLYFLPAAPVTVAATLGAVATAGTRPGGRRWPLASAAATLAFAVQTTTAFQPINERLFMAPDPPTEHDRADLLRRWYRLNTVRLALVGLAWMAAQRAKARQRG
jgi:Domain of unknown function (DUF1772)